MRRRDDLADVDPSPAFARRLRRSLGVARVGVGRVVGRLTGPTPGRTVFCLLGVAVAVAMMITVTGIALGLTSSTTIASEDVDYWIVPEDSTADSLVVDAGGTGLGDVHDAAGQIGADERVEYVTPVGMHVLRVSTATAEEYVLVVGVIPPADGRDVAGVSTAALSESYPHRAGGSYDGEWTGEAVASTAAADVLGADVGTSVRVESGDVDRSFTVVDVDSAGGETGFGPLPVLVVHLAELQTVTDTAAHDRADQLLVSTTDRAVRSDLEGVYPGTSVVSRSGAIAPSFEADDLSAAVGLSAFVVAVAVGTLFVVTMMGLEVTADRRRLATLSSLGLSDRTRGMLVAVETVTVALLGGVVGLLLGLAGVAAVNQVGTSLEVGSLAVYPPWFVGYGLGVAVLIGLIAVPYPVWLTRRSTVSEVIR